jgi:hypothetical protein
MRNVAQELEAPHRVALGAPRVEARQELGEQLLPFEQAHAGDAREHARAGACARAPGARTAAQRDEGVSALANASREVEGFGRVRKATEIPAKGAVEPLRASRNPS